MSEVDFLSDTMGRLLTGLPITLQLAAISVSSGMVLAVLMAVARNASRPAEWAVRGYVFVLRGTPLLLQIFLIYYGLGQFAAVRDSVLWPMLRQPWWCAILALTFNTAAYGSEIVRGGLNSVPAGAIEAARVAGMSRATLYRRIVLPIALRQALPAYGNEMVIMIKSTSLASIVTLMEVTGIAYAIISETYRALEVFLCAGAIYLTLNFLLTRAIGALERRLNPAYARIGGAMSEDIAVAVTGLHKRFGGLEVLKGVTLAARTGEVISIIGASGSGKSTLLRCIPLLEVPEEGEVAIAGETVRLRHRRGTRQPADAAQVNRLRAQLGFVFQSFNLWQHMTVLQNVIEAPIHVQRRPRAEVVAEAESILEKVGMADKRAAYPAHLSGGQQQRAAIARALAMRPRALLFDEPTSALDPELVGEVLLVIRDLAEEGRTMLIVTHEMAFAAEVSTHAVFLHDGRIEEQGPPTQIFRDPTTDRARQFVQRHLNR